MIRVNLLPGGKKRKARGGGGGIKLPSFGGAGALTDPWMLATFLVPLVALGAAGWMYLSVGNRADEVQLLIEEELQDSVRFAEIRVQSDLLTAQAADVTAKINIIQEIDQGRYVWPHILDEVARSLPDYTWLTQLSEVSGGAEPTFEIQGRSGNTFAMTTFYQQLENSPFIRGVELVQAVNVQDQNSGQIVTEWEFRAQYEQPPMELIETVPLFGPAAGGGAAGVMEPDTTGTGDPAGEQGG